MTTAPSAAADNPSSPTRSEASKMDASPVSASTDRVRLHSYGPFLAVAVLFLGIYCTTFAFMVGRWYSDPAATHGWLVLPIVAWVVWEKRNRLRATPLSTNRNGLWVMGIALLMHLAEKAIDLNGPSPLSIPIFVAGAVWYFAGTEWLRELCFPIAYLSFMIPIPGGLTQVVTFPLQLMASDGSRAIVSHLGVAIQGSGTHMDFWQPGRPHIPDNLVAMEIAVPCSGIHSLMAIKALHAITAYKTRLRLSWKWVLFMCAIPVALAANLCRIVSIILVSAYINKTFGLGMWHENIAPYLVFGFAVVILINLGKFMEWATRAPKHVKKADLLAPDPVSVSVDSLPESAAFTWPMNARPHFRAITIMLAAAFAISTFYSLRTENDDVPIASLGGIPGDLGPWRCFADRSQDTATMAELKADSFLDRVYQNRQTGQNVELMVVYRRYGRREFAHRPDQCYPAAGYNLVLKDHTTLPYAGRAIDAIHLIADGSHVPLMNGKTGVPTQTLTYFFASGARTECDFIKQQLLMAIERLSPNKNGWTFVRLNSMCVTNDEDALEAQQDFMRSYGPAIQQAITTDRDADSATDAATTTTDAVR